MSATEDDPHHLASRHLTERLANSVTHGFGLAASLVALPVLIASAARTADMLQVIGAATFGVSLVVLYAASTVYHSFPQTPSTKVLRVIDHSAIYILIAGSYTPFLLGPLRGSLGYSMLGVVWLMAIAGILMKTMRGFGRPIFTTVPYIVMGWLGAIIAKPLIAEAGMTGFWWLLAGGLFYTVGTVFYATDKRVRYGHAVWHLFVLAGSTCHFFAVLWHSRPAIS